MIYVWLLQSITVRNGLMILVQASSSSFVLQSMVQALCLLRTWMSRLRYTGRSSEYQNIISSMYLTVHFLFYLIVLLYFACYCNMYSSFRKLVPSSLSRSNKQDKNYKVCLNKWWFYHIQSNKQDKNYKVWLNNRWFYHIQMTFVSCVIGRKSYFGSDWTIKEGPADPRFLHPCLITDFVLSIQIMFTSSWFQIDLKIYFEMLKILIIRVMKRISIRELNIKNNSS